MFTSQVDMKMVLEINKSLRDHHLQSEVHTYSGCATCGLRLERKNGEDINYILNIIQAYLDRKWMKVTLNAYDKEMLYINSKFE